MWSAWWQKRKPSRPVSRPARRSLVVELLEDRLTPSAGALDPTFGIDGKVFDPRFEDARDVLVLPDGKLLVAGQNGDAALLARFLPDGSLDVTFGSGGSVEIPVTGGLGAEAIIHDIALAPDGKIVAAG